MGRELNRMAFGGSETVPEPFHCPHSPALSIDLLNLAGENGIYGTSHQNPRSRILKAGILLKTSTISPELGLALSEMTAMMSLGATEITFPVAGCENNLNPEIRFEIHEDGLVSDDVKLISQKSGAPRVIRIQGNPRTLPGALKKWFALAMADGGPGCKNIDRFREQVAMFQQLVSGKGYAGRRLHAGIVENPSWKFLKQDPSASI